MRLPYIALSLAYDMAVIWQWKSLLVSWWWLILALGSQGLVHGLGVFNRTIG